MALQNNILKYFLVKFGHILKLRQKSRRFNMYFSMASINKQMFFLQIFVINMCSRKTGIIKSKFLYEEAPLEENFEQEEVASTNSEFDGDFPLEIKVLEGVEGYFTEGIKTVSEKIFKMFNVLQVEARKVFQESSRKITESWNKFLVPMKI